MIIFEVLVYLYLYLTCIVVMVFTSNVLVFFRHRHKWTHQQPTPWYRSTLDKITLCQQKTINTKSMHQYYSEWLSVFPMTHQGIKCSQRETRSATNRKADVRLHGMSMTWDHITYLYFHVFIMILGMLFMTVLKRTHKYIIVASRY